MDAKLHGCSRHTVVQLVALLLVGCGVPVADCRSPCGVDLFYSKDCQGFSDAEDRTLAAFDKHVDGWQLPKTCTNLKDSWRVIVEPRTKWQSMEGIMVAGETYCDMGAIVVGNPAWKVGALAHEYAHAVERCVDPDHKEWEKKGIWRAIDEANQ